MYICIKTLFTKNELNEIVAIRTKWNVILDEKYTTFFQEIHLYQIFLYSGFWSLVRTPEKLLSKWSNFTLLMELMSNV